MGADTLQLEAILTTKLKIDDRKPLSFGRRQQKKQSKFNSALAMLFSFFIGIVYIFPLFAFKDPIIALWAYFTTFLFLLTFSLITDFSSVITDTTDKLILLSRPINDRTVFLARMLHIFIYLIRVVLPMSLPGWILLGLVRGWKAAIVFPLPLLLMVFLALFLVNAFYLAILRLAKPGRFKDIMGSIQVAFSVIVFMSFYLMQGLTKSAVANIDMSQYPWIQFTPPYWLAACWSWVGYSTVFPHLWAFSILAIVFPLFAIWATVKWLAPQFSLRLAAIDGIDVTELKPGTNVRKAPSKLYSRLANTFNRSQAAKAGFMITWLQTSRSRTFKMRVYPMLAYAPVYFFYMLVSRDEPLSDVWQRLPESNMHLVLLYMCSLSMMQALNYVSMSDQYKAAWIYYSAPIDTPGSILAGAFKALWIKYFLPFMIAIGAFVIFVWGPRAILDMLLATANISVFAICVMRASHRIFPFSMMEQMKEKGGKGVVRVLFTFLLMGMLGLGHYLILQSISSELMMVLAILLASAFFWMVWESCRETDWKSIRTAEA